MNIEYISTQIGDTPCNIITDVETTTTTKTRKLYVLYDISGSMQGMPRLINNKLNKWISSTYKDVEYICFNQRTYKSSQLPTESNIGGGTDIIMVIVALCSMFNDPNIIETIDILFVTDGADNCNNNFTIIFNDVLTDLSQHINIGSMNILGINNFDLRLCTKFSTVFPQSALNFVPIRYRDIPEEFNFNTSTCLNISAYKYMLESHVDAVNVSSSIYPTVTTNIEGATEVPLNYSICMNILKYWTRCIIEQASCGNNMVTTVEKFKTNAQVLVSQLLILYDNPHTDNFQNKYQGIRTLRDIRKYKLGVQHEIATMINQLDDLIIKGNILRISDQNIAQYLRKDNKYLAKANKLRGHSADSWESLRDGFIEALTKCLNNLISSQELPPADKTKLLKELKEGTFNTCDGPVVDAINNINSIVEANVITQMSITEMITIYYKDIVTDLQQVSSMDELILFMSDWFSGKPANVQPVKDGSLMNPWMITFNNTQPSNTIPMISMNLNDGSIAVGSGDTVDYNCIVPIGPFDEIPGIGYILRSKLFLYAMQLVTIKEHSTQPDSTIYIAIVCNYYTTINRMEKTDYHNTLLDWCLQSINAANNTKWKTFIDTMLKDLDNNTSACITNSDTLKSLNMVIVGLAYCNKYHPREDTQSAITILKAATKEFFRRCYPRDVLPMEITIMNVSHPLTSEASLLNYYTVAELNTAFESIPLNIQKQVSLRPLSFYKEFYNLGKAGDVKFLDLSKELLSLGVSLDSASCLELIDTIENVSLKCNNNAILDHKYKESLAIHKIDIWNSLKTRFYEELRDSHIAYAEVIEDLDATRAKSKSMGYPDSDKLMISNYAHFLVGGCCIPGCPHYLRYDSRAGEHINDVNYAHRNMYFYGGTRRTIDFVRAGGKLESNAVYNMLVEKSEFQVDEKIGREHVAEIIDRIKTYNLI